MKKMIPITPKLEWEKLSPKEKFLWGTPFVGKHKENYSYASSILAKREEFPFIKWSSYTKIKEIEKFFLNIKEILEYPNHHFIPEDQLEGFLSSSHFGVDGYELEKIANDYEKLCQMKFPEENWGSMTLGELFAPLKNK
jgi:hypothetical protein